MLTDEQIRKFYPGYKTDKPDVVEQIKVCNEIRMGMKSLLDQSYTHGYVAVVNTNLSSLLESLTDDEGVQLMNIFSQSYAFLKTQLEHKRKIKIAEEVADRENGKLAGARKVRKNQADRKADKIARAIASTPQQFSSDPKIDKAIKEMVKAMNCTPEMAVTLLISMGALPEEFKL